MKTRLLAPSRIALLAWAALSAGATSAGNDFAELGRSLTPVGAEMAANSSGTIPAWTGGLQPDAAKVERRFLSDPFSTDEPVFVITAANHEQYADNLTPGQIALFKRYPETFQMPVYPTRRSVSFPDYVYDKVRETAGKAQLVNNGDGITNFYFDYFAFPIPKSGIEVLWNHKTRYRINVERTYVNAAPLQNGRYTPIKMHDMSAYPQYIAGVDLEKEKGIFAYLKQRTIAPARQAGNVLLVHDTLNPLEMPRMAWTYSAGQRRVRRAPQVAYDNPDAATDSLRTSDNFFLYSGAPDRYNWTLVAKKEIYVPYNAYQATSNKLKYNDIVRPGHINPDVTRYELHRVWEVQGNLKDGQRHIYAQRNFFIDEDSWMILLADHYDSRDTLWRVGAGHLVQVYDKQIPAYGVEVLHDLIAGRYAVMGMTNEEESGPNYDAKPVHFEFTTASLRASGVR